MSLTALKWFTAGRSPHGERGLKLKVDLYSPIEEAVAPRMGSVD